MQSKAQYAFTWQQRTHLQETWPVLLELQVTIFFPRLRWKYPWVWEERQINLIWQWKRAADVTRTPEQLTPTETSDRGIP